MTIPRDPAGATYAYLSTLDPAAVARSIDYTHGQHWLLLGSKLLTILVCIVILRTGLLDRARDAAGGTRRPNVATFGTAAAFLVVQALLLLPFWAYADWWRERGFELSSQPLGEWLAQTVQQSVVNALLGGSLMAALYAVIRSRGRRWWLWTGAGGAVIAMLAVTVAPALLATSGGHRALPAAPARDAIASLTRKAGLPDAPVVVSDEPATAGRYTATVTGIGPLRRISVSEAVLRDPVDLPAVRAVVAHEIGHWRHHHLAILGAAVAMLVALGLLVADRLFAHSARLMRPGSPPTLADPAGLPVLFAIAAVFTLVTTPLVNTAMRAVENDADAYGLELAREPDGAARGLLATVDQRAPSPGPIEEALFFDHPSIAHRVRAAMDWKAAHQRER